MVSNVSFVQEAGACCSCGLCAAACGPGAIGFANDRGSWVPEVDPERCVACGMCLSVCPGSELTRPQGSEPSRAELIGKVVSSYSAWSSDERVLANAVSGGFVTQLVSSLLHSGAYDSAFLVTDVPRDGRVVSARMTADDDLARSQKSRYLQVSHEPTLRHMISHREERSIVVAVPCALSGISRAIRRFGLARERYLLVGLFCDRTMTANVLRYFERFAPGGRMEQLDFRTKASSGWPGDVRVYGSDGYADLPAQRRMEVKGFFQPECCLYCLDKLNRCADISVGDDYVHGRRINDGRGACSVLVRTETGVSALEMSSGIELVPTDEEAIAESQHLDRRTSNWGHAIARLNEGPLPDVQEGFSRARRDVPKGAVRLLHSKLRDLNVGAVYPENPKLLESRLTRMHSPLAKARGLSRRALMAVTKLVKRAKSQI